MSDGSEKSGNSIINVIDEFNYSTQNDTYNEKFRKWRRKRENPFAFSFEANMNERVFIDGKGFIDHSAADTEKEVLTHIFYFIGLAGLLWVLMDDIISKLGISLFGVLGFNIHNNFFSSAIYGGSFEIVAALIAAGVLKAAVPAVFLHVNFRLPTRVEFMSSLNSRGALLGAISMALIVCTATSMPNAYSSESRDIYDFFRNLDADVSVWDQEEFLVYTIFDVIVMPIISEMFFRGAMFAVLRQFGDPFAIVMTSLTAGLLTQDFRAMPGVILVSLVASYGMVSSGTIFTAISVSVVSKMYGLAIMILETNPTEKMPLTRNIFMLIALAAGIVGFMLFWFITIRKNKNYGIARYSSELTAARRFIHSAKTFPYSAVAVVCLLYAVIRAAL